MEKINQLSMAKTFLLSLLIFGFYFTAMYDDGSRLENNIKATKGQMAKIKRDIVVLTKAKADAERFRRLEAELGETLDKIAQNIPEELTEYDMMELLSKEAKEAGANISNVEASKKRTAKGSVYEEVAIDIEIEGTYTQVMLFLSYVTRVNKIIVLKKMKMQKRNTKDEDPNSQTVLNFTGVFVGYKYIGGKGKGKKG